MIRLPWSESVALEPDGRVQRSAQSETSSQPAGILQVSSLRTRPPFARLALGACAALAPLLARAEPAPAPTVAPAPPPPATVPEPTAPAGPAISRESTGQTATGPAATATPPDPRDARLDELARQNEELRERVEALESDAEWNSQRVDQLMPLTTRLGGYFDFGFFWVRGDGRGIRTDLGHRALPEYEGVVPDSWVFLGDPLAVAVNSRGDPADLNESRAITFDPIGNGGKPSMILNALNLQLFTGVGDDLTINGAVDLVPRSRNVSDPDGVGLGDYLDVKLAYAEYRLEPFGTKLSLFAGKFDSVLGYEYRVQESPVRITVTPSLLCRYLCGHPLGLKARWSPFSEDRLVLNVAVTNGSHFTESFDFADEVDVNAGKTIAGRLSTRLDLGAGLELGASGAYGTQDAQTETEPIQWHYGFDAHLEAGDLNFTAEFVQGKAEGQDVVGEPPCSAAPCLEYLGAYGLLGYRFTGWLMPYARSDFRKALHTSGASFVYYSRLVRGTGGIRFDLGTNVVVKGEYTHIVELGAVPSFDNDVLTSSLVARW
jgi:hypothetical protein